MGELLDPQLAVNGDQVELPVEWSVNLGHERPRERRVALLVAAGAAIVGIALVQQALAALTGFLVVLGATSELFLSQKFRIDEAGAHVKTGASSSSIAWSDVKRATETEDGLTLFSLEKPSRMDAFRRVQLRFCGNRDQLLVKIASLLNEHGCVVVRRSESGGDGRPGGEALEGDQEAGA